MVHTSEQSQYMGVLEWRKPMRIKPCGSTVTHYVWSPLWDTVKALNRELHSIAIRPHVIVDRHIDDIFTLEEAAAAVEEGLEDEVVRELPELVPEVEDKVVAPVIELMEIQYD